jgi:hypothetical protein
MPAQRRYSDEELRDLRDLAKRKVLEAVMHTTKDNYLAGKGWYDVAHVVANRLGEHGAAIIAVLSPMVSWPHNLTDAKAIVNGDEPTYALGDNVAKAKRILSGEHPQAVLGGRKVLAFFQNVLHPDEGYTVTLDTHMAKLIGLPAYEVFQLAGVYDALSDGVRDAADELGLRPNQVQAIAWLHQSGRNGYGKDLPDPF